MNISVYRRLRKTPILTVGIIWALLCFGEANLSVEVSSEETDEGTTITVDNRPGNPSRAEYNQFSRAISSSKVNTQIRLSEGVYFVNNPIRFSIKGIRMVGSGASRTIIRPRNSGKAIFVIEADGIVIENIGINAMTDSRNERATFGLRLTPGIKHFGVVDSQILHTGASSILGHSITQSFFTNNRIVDAGDDGIQLSGKGLTVTNNLIVGVYDEPIDVLSGDHILIKNNYVTLGRIGITVGNTSQLVINHNTVMDQSMEGIISYSKGMGVVSDNMIFGTQKTSMELHSPFLVSGNVVDRSNGLGFFLQGMQGGIIEDNLVRNSLRGYKFVEIKDSFLRSNVFCNSNLSSIKKESNIENNHSERGGHVARIGQSFFTPREITQIPCRLDQLRPQKGRVQQTEFPVEKAPSLNALIALYEEKNRGPVQIKIEGPSDKDKKIGNQIREFLSRHNPGFLSISVKGSIMKCEINDDLYETMMGAGQLGIGLFRMPYMIFRGGRHAGCHELSDS